MVGGARIACEAFLLEILAEDLEGDALGTWEESKWACLVRVDTQQYFLEQKTVLREPAVRDLGRELLELLAGRLTELELMSMDGAFYVSFGATTEREILRVSGRMQRDGAAMSVFESIASRAALEEFADQMRRFPYA